MFIVEALHSQRVYFKKVTSNDFESSGWWDMDIPKKPPPDIIEALEGLAHWMVVKSLTEWEGEI
jgi:hypothetical protein